MGTTVRVGFTCGAFDLCHAGHMLMFRECKEVCDYLVVGLHADPSFDRQGKNRPIMDVAERRILLEGIRYIDEIIEYRTEADLLKLLQGNIGRFHVRILGADWEGKQFTGHELPIPIHFNRRDHGFSTSELRGRIFKAELLKAQR